MQYTFTTDAAASFNKNAALSTRSEKGKGVN